MRESVARAAVIAMLANPTSRYFERKRETFSMRGAHEACRFARSSDADGAAGDLADPGTDEGWSS